MFRKTLREERTVCFSVMNWRWLVMCRSSIWELGDLAGVGAEAPSRDLLGRCPFTGAER